LVKVLVGTPHWVAPVPYTLMLMDTLLTYVREEQPFAPQPQLASAVCGPPFMGCVQAVDMQYALPAVLLRQ